MVSNHPKVTKVSKAPKRWHWKPFFNRHNPYLRWLKHVKPFLLYSFWCRKLGKPVVSLRGRHVWWLRQSPTVSWWMPILGDGWASVVCCAPGASPTVCWFSIGKPWRLYLLLWANYMGQLCIFYGPPSMGLTTCLPKFTDQLSVITICLSL